MIKNSFCVICLLFVFNLSGLKAVEDLPLVEILTSTQDTLPDVQSLFDQYPFLQKEANVIIDNDNMKAFFSKLQQLERGEIDQVRIVHIGDSHIQADFWSGYLRRLFQQRFGSAGRGLIFPFALAESHNALDIKTNSNTTWQYHRNIFKNGPPIGLAGASISTSKADFFIDLIVKDSFPEDKFNKITLFNNKGSSAFDFTLGKGDVSKADQKKIPTKRRYHRVRSGETLSHLARRYHCSVSSLKRWNRLRTSRINIGQRLIVSKPIYVKSKTPDFVRFAYLANTEYPDSVFAATLILDQPVNQLVIKGEKQSPDQNEIVFYGISLENTLQPGILYHAIGVNGATFYHYNKAALFFEQVGKLNADLIIVSLGTNESLSSGFNKDKFTGQVAAFSKKLRTQFPEASVLFTTNPSALKKKTYENPANEAVREVIIEEARLNNYSVWDLQSVMGGKGGMKNWQQVNMAQPDGVHFKKKGYELQAKILFDSIMKGYYAKH